MNDDEKFLAINFNCTNNGYCAKSNLKGGGAGQVAVSPSITVLSLSNSEGGPSTTAGYRVVKSGAHVNEGFL